jgi:hypothetical protein
VSGRWCKTRDGGRVQELRRTYIESQKHAELHKEKKEDAHLLKARFIEEAREGPNAA